MKFCLSIWLALQLASAALAVADNGHPLTLWQVNGAHNNIYLLGSIHMLRATDHPIPDAIYEAYADAEVVIMELDMDDLDEREGETLFAELGLIDDGRTLRDLMGAERYAEAELLADSLQIPLAQLANAEPWYAAISIEVMMLMRSGFDPAYGLEARLAELAARDQKEIRGLETIREQLQLLDTLSPEAQRDMLMQTLAESADIAGLMDELVDAWRHGDFEFLEQNLLDDMQGQTELHQALVVNRNVNWVGQIQRLLDDEDDYLIVVGALHLVGEDGVPAMLVESGLDVRQLSQPPGATDR